eukprot:365560-Chlamydomonas_euryale.AAC.8
MLRHSIADHLTVIVDRSTQGEGHSPLPTVYNVVGPAFEGRGFPTCAPSKMQLFCSVQIDLNISCMCSRGNRNLRVEMRQRRHTPARQTPERKKTNTHAAARLATHEGLWLRGRAA